MNLFPLSLTQLRGQTPFNPPDPSGEGLGLKQRTGRLASPSYAGTPSWAGSRLRVPGSGFPKSVSPNIEKTLSAGVLNITEGGPWKVQASKYIKPAQLENERYAAFPP